MGAPQASAYTCVEALAWHLISQHNTQCTNSTKIHWTPVPSTFHPRRSITKNPTATGTAAELNLTSQTPAGPSAGVIV